jgi:hypothetical protein
MVDLNIKDKVLELLKRHPHLRDSDEKLTANIWLNESRGVVTAYDLLNLYANGGLTNAESIRRCRQKIQMENPELRGSSYEKRHAKQTKIKEQLGYESKNLRPIPQDNT